MKGSRKVLCVLVVLMGVMGKETRGEVLKGEVLKGKELINKVCSTTDSKELCLDVLSSDPERSPKADLFDLAIISLSVAARNASSILNDTKTFIEDAELNPKIQQGLADCKENILDAEMQLEDTIGALLAWHEFDTDKEAQLWLKAAMAAIDTCAASIPGDDDVLSVKSQNFRKLCNIVIAISNLLATNPPSAA